jgi:hypothetical protein
VTSPIRTADFVPFGSSATKEILTKSAPNKFPMRGRNQKNEPLGDDLVMVGKDHKINHGSLAATRSIAPKFDSSTRLLQSSQGIQRQTYARKDTHHETKQIQRGIYDVQASNMKLSTVNTGLMSPPKLKASHLGRATNVKSNISNVRTEISEQRSVPLKRKPLSSVGISSLKASGADRSKRTDAADVVRANKRPHMDASNSERLSGSHNDERKIGAIQQKTEKIRYVRLCWNQLDNFVGPNQNISSRFRVVQDMDRQPESILSARKKPNNGLQKKNESDGKKMSPGDWFDDDLKF